MQSARISSLSDYATGVGCHLDAAVEDARRRYGRRVAVVEQARGAVEGVVAPPLMAVPTEVLGRLQAADPVLVVAESLAARHRLGR